MTATKIGSSKLEIPTDLKLVDMEGEEAPDFESCPMESEAFSYWSDRETSFRWHLPLDVVKIYAKALGRPIRLDEIRELVGNDGSEVTCAVTGKKFQPVFWIIPFSKVSEVVVRHRDVCKALKELDKLDRVTLRYGHFFQVKRGDRLGNELRPVFGNPYFVSLEGFHPDRKSPFVKASLANAERLGKDPIRPMWGLSMAEFNNRLRRHEEKVREKEEEYRRAQQRAMVEQQRIDENIEKLFL